MQICLIHKQNVGARANEITENRSNCITEYNKHMGGVDSLDAHVSVYRINVRGKNWYWPHYINTIDVLKSAAFKVFKLVSPDDKMDGIQIEVVATQHYIAKKKIVERKCSCSS